MLSVRGDLSFREKLAVSRDREHTIVFGFVRSVDALFIVSGRSIEVKFVQFYVKTFLSQFLNHVFNHLRINSDELPATAGSSNIVPAYNAKTITVFANFRVVYLLSVCADYCEVSGLARY